MEVQLANRCPVPHKIKVHPAPPTARKTCPEPLKTFTATQLSTLDPSGSRARLFSRTDPDAVHLGDVLLVRFRSGEPFAGVVLSIRRRGVDSAVLLRNQLTRIGTELWVKIYSPLVVGMEVVQRTERRARRARLFYMRKKKHDRGSLEKVVENYMRRRRELGRGTLSGGSRGGKSGDGKVGTVKR